MKWILVYTVALAGIGFTLGVRTPPRSFRRTCTDDGGCNFNSQASDTVFLPCKHGKCVCEEPKYKMMDVAFYSVSLVTGNCVVKGKAPCGTVDGLTLVCQSGKSCLEGRCRAPGDIKSTPVNHACDEQIDCQEGLVCRSNNDFPIMSYCVKP